MLELYKKHLEARHLSADTIKCHVRNTEEFIASFANVDLRDIELTHFIRYRKRLAKRPIIIATQNTKMWHLKAFFTFLHERGKLLVNPAADLPVLKIPRRLPRAILSGKQVIALLRNRTPERKSASGIAPSSNSFTQAASGRGNSAASPSTTSTTRNAAFASCGARAAKTAWSPLAARLSTGVLNKKSALTT